MKKFSSSGSRGVRQILSAKIGTITEIRKIIDTNKNISFIIGGPAAAVFESSSRILPLRYDAEKYAYSMIAGSPADERRSAAEIARWSLQGARVVREHPSWPNIICEIETYRGCPRQQHCTFCSRAFLISWSPRHVNLAEVVPDRRRHQPIPYRTPGGYTSVHDTLQQLQEWLS
jgi:radical SAM superfamily enzyme with C-terminal helix-hairpin-helix motif